MIDYATFMDTGLEKITIYNPECCFGYETGLHAGIEFHGYSFCCVVFLIFIRYRNNHALKLEIYQIKKARCNDYQF